LIDKITANRRHFIQNSILGASSLLATAAGAKVTPRLDRSPSTNAEVPSSAHLKENGKFSDVEFNAKRDHVFNYPLKRVWNAWNHGHAKAGEVSRGSLNTTGVRMSGAKFDESVAIEEKLSGGKWGPVDQRSGRYMFAQEIWGYEIANFYDLGDGRTLLRFEAAGILGSSLVPREVMLELLNLVYEAEAPYWEADVFPGVEKSLAAGEF
jgi:hypothetical protein